MKRNILISVLFSLVLVFGVLVASCDNGVLPPPPTDPKNIEAELWGLPNGRPPAPTSPAPDDPYYFQDFWTVVGGFILPGGDNIPDFDADGNLLTLTQAEGDDLIGTTDTITILGVDYTVTYSAGTVSGTGTVLDGLDTVKATLAP